MRQATTPTHRFCPNPAATLAVLEEAMRRTPTAAPHRVIAGSDPKSVDEGLTVLRCYVTIADPQIRQAILDVLVSAADTDLA